MNPCKIEELIAAINTEDILLSIDNESMKSAIGHRRRSGAGRVNNLSRYSYHRKDKWGQLLCESVKKHLCTPLWENYLQMQILRLPKEGFLDLQTAWRDSASTTNFKMIPAIASFVAISLHDNQSINIYSNNDLITFTCNAGDAVCFDPESAHEILPVTEQNDWLVIMVGKPFAQHFINEY